MSSGKKKRPRAGFEGIGYPWAITLGIGTPVGGVGQPSGAIAEEEALRPYHPHGDIDHDESTVKSASAALADHYGLHHPDLVNRHNDAIRYYTGNSDHTNKYLATKKDDIQSGKHHFPSEFDDLLSDRVSKAISSAKPYDKPITVYSGMHESVPPHVIQQHGGLFHFPRFLSTSTDPKTALNFASKNASGERHVIKFDIPSDYNHGTFIGPGSEKPEENEYLIDKDRMIHVSHKISSRKDKSGTTTHLWQGHLLSPEDAANHAVKHPFAQSEYESYKKATTQSMFEDAILTTVRRHVPNEDEGLAKARYTMPQVDKSKLLADIGHDGFTRENVSTDSLIPTQKHFNWEKVDGIASSGKPISEIIVSQDGYVVDGHHRWLGAHNRDGKMDIVRVKQNAEDLLKFLKDKPYVTTKKLNESVFASDLIRSLLPGFYD